MLVYAKNINQANFNQVAIDEEVLATFTLEDKKGRYRYENFVRARSEWSRVNKPKNWYPIYVSEDLKDITSEKKNGYFELYPTTDSGDYSWKNIKKSFNDLNVDNYFKAEKDGDKVNLYHKYYEQQVFKNVWTDKKYQSEFHGTNLLKNIIGKNNFSYPKSLFAVIDVVKIMTKPDDIVLDFYAGSGTTAHAVLKLNKEDNGNRQFILIEQLKEHIDICNKRIQKILKLEDINNSFAYLELKKWNQHYIDDIEDAKTTKKLLTIYKKMKSEAYFRYDVDLTKFEENDFSKLELEQQKEVLIECLDKNHLYVNLSEMDDATYDISNEDKAMNKKFYGLD